MQILKYTKGTPPEALLLVTPSSGRRHQNPIYIHIQKRRYKNTQIHQYTKPQIHKGDASSGTPPSADGNETQDTGIVARISNVSICCNMPTAQAMLIPIF